MQCYIFADYLAKVKTNLEYRNLIFDLGGVLVDLAPEKMFQSVAAISDFDVFDLQKASELKIFEDFELGKLSSADFLDVFKRDFNSNASHHDLIEAFNHMIDDVPKKGIELIKNLNAKHRVFLLSNTNEIHTAEINRIIRAKYRIDNLAELFEKVYYSFDINLKKPGEEIFKFLLEDSAINATETLFIDDNHSNLLGAEGVGIKVLHAPQPEVWYNYFK